MKRTLSMAALVFALLAAAGAAAIAQRGGASAPSLSVNPLWPNHCPIIGCSARSPASAVDAQNHVWVVHRGATRSRPTRRG